MVCVGVLCVRDVGSDKGPIARLKDHASLIVSRPARKDTFNIPRALFPF